MQWVAGVVDVFGFQHSEVMRMPFRTFMGYQRLATTRNVNKRMRTQFETAIGG